MLLYHYDENTWKEKISRKVLVNLRVFYKKSCYRYLLENMYSVRFKLTKFVVKRYKSYVREM